MKQGKYDDRKFRRIREPVFKKQGKQQVLFLGKEVFFPEIVPYRQVRTGIRLIGRIS